MIKKPLLLWLLAALPVWAADEDLAPNGDQAVEDAGYACFVDTTQTDCSNLCNANDCYLRVDEDPDGTRDAYSVGASVNGGEYGVEFPTPTNPPSFGTDAQTIHITWTKAKVASNPCEEDCATGAEPAPYVYLFCNDVNKATIDSGTWAIANGCGASYTDIWIDFTIHADCASDGSDLQIVIAMGATGTDPNIRRAALQAIEWEVTWTSAARGVILTN